MLRKKERQVEEQSVVVQLEEAECETVTCTERI